VPSRPGQQRSREAPEPEPGWQPSAADLASWNVGDQFRSDPSPRVRDALGEVLGAYQRAKYFRHAGFGAALAYSFGLPHYPHPFGVRTPTVVGLQPSGMEVDNRYW
jgi:hypothetical protein